MSADLNTTLVPFHGAEILCVETMHGIFVAIKPICQHLGLDFSAQYRRVLRHDTLYGVARMAIPSAGGMQETVCIPITRLAIWLTSVQANRVKPERRAEIELFQEEAAEVLDNHFRQKQAQQHHEIDHLRNQLAACHLHILAANPKWAQIKVMADVAGICERDMAARVRMPVYRLMDERSYLEDCGLLTHSGLADFTAASHLERIRILEADLWYANKNLVEDRPNG